MRDQSSALSPVWQDITARELPISEDEWIREAVSPEARQRWDAWLLMPRFRVCHDFPAWSVVVVAFCDEARGGALMQLLRQNLREQRAAAFAICRTTHRLFRWDRLPIAADVGEVGSVPLASEWDDPDRRIRWESLLADRRHWYLSSCAQSFRSGLWLPELVNANVGSGLGDFGWHSIVGEEPPIAARPRTEHRRGLRELNRRERRIAQLALKEIKRQGRADVIQLAEAAGMGPVASAAVNYNWLCRASTHALPRRIQAIAAVPVLLPLLLQVSNTAEQRNGVGVGVGDVDSDVDVDSPLLRAELDRVVDGGEPLLAWLAAACGMSERTVRHLRTSALRQHTFKPLLLLSSTNSWRDFAERCLAYLGWLDALAVERWPQTARQWRTWAELMSAAERTFDASRVFAAGSSVGNDGAQLYPFAERVFQAEAARGWRNRRFDAPGWTLVRDYDQATLAVRELVRSIEMVAQAGHPAMEVDDADKGAKGDNGDHHDGEFLVDRFDRVRLCALSEQRAGKDPEYANAVAELRSWSMSQWQEAGRRWQTLWVPEAERDGAETLGADDDHEHEDEALGAQANANGHVNAKYGWLPLFAASDVPALVQTLATRYQRTLVWLISPRALAREGRAMQHCVTSFTEECAHQREHVASMRDLSGQRLSTLRLRLHYTDGRWVPELLEHRGMMNAAPNAFCGAAVRTVMEAITEPDTGDHLQARWEALEAARKLRWAARVATRGERHRESVAEHRAVLDEVLPPGMAAALGG